LGRLKDVSSVTLLFYGKTTETASAVGRIRENFSGFKAALRQPIGGPKHYPYKYSLLSSAIQRFTEQRVNEYPSAAACIAPCWKAGAEETLMAHCMLSL